MSGILWLASYPKSGNTWMRVFLSNYWLDADEPIHINQLSVGGPIASANDLFDDAVGVEASDLTQAEIERYRPLIYDQIASDLDDMLFVKIHDAYLLNKQGIPLVSQSATFGVVYLIRNPLDVAVSFANHISAPVDRAISNMNNPEFSLVSPGKGHRQLTQHLLTWSGHVQSWVDKSGFNVLVVRFEDMKQSPVETFSQVVQFARLDFDESRLEKAIDFSTFDKLKAQEEEEGFRERLIRTKAFFRKGEIGSWRSELNPEQVEQIIANHSYIMQRFGYLTASGEPVF